MEEYLIGGIVGAVIGYLINGILDKIRVGISKRIESKKIFKIREQLQSTNFEKIADYMAIDHAVPKYIEGNIVITEDKKNMLVHIPEAYREQLDKLGFVSHLDDNIDNSIIENSFKHLGIVDYESILSAASVSVAEEFIKELNDGKIRFNGYLWGVEHIRINRKGDSENPTLNMKFYKTDYFTYRVFAKLYQDHKKQIVIQGIEDLNALPAFMCSFGLGCYVIATDGEEEFLIIAHRGNNVIVDKNKYHFSMNEAFSLKDTDIYEKISLKSCLFRGLREELGLNEKYADHIVDHGFLDFDIVLDRFEMGITCYAILKFDQSFKMEDFKDLYISAQDKELETTELKFIPMKQVRNFIKNHETEMSVGCLNGLKSLMSRYHSGFIVSGNPR